jgi:hypothetical protein
MASSRKLIIHIGSHKTGSTSIQKALVLNQACLEAQGFALFNQGPNGETRASGNALTWIKFRLSQKSRVEGVFHQGLAEALAAAGDNVIVSAETFSWVFGQNAINKLAAELHKHFENISIVAFLRRQDRQAVSQYQQASKPGAIVASRFYGRGSAALPLYQPHFNCYLDYHQRLGLWADAFGEEALRISIFEPAHLHNGDAVDEFFHAVGLSIEERPEKLNESNGFERTKVGHLMSAMEYPEHLWRRVSAQLDNSGRMLPSRQQAQEFYAHFQQSNERLRRRFLPQLPSPIFEEGFSNYPESAQDQWTEDSASQAITHLLKAMEHSFPVNKKELDLMAQCADALVSSHPQLSAALLEIEEKLRYSKSVAPGVTARLRRTVRKLLRR